jgi:sterol desaturase/sphingolipid hydroxylase (fatty acid hydroxylase superfamily)
LGKREGFSERLVAVFVGMTVLALDPIGAAWAQFLVIFVNLTYHTNIKTPRWMGCFIQRPEMNLIHHARSMQYYNFADLPIGDIIFGTFRNPEPPYSGACGFAQLAELKVLDQIIFKEVDPDLVAQDFRDQH